MVCRRITGLPRWSLPLSGQKAAGRCQDMACPAEPASTPAGLILALSRDWRDSPPFWYTFSPMFLSNPIKVPNRVMGEFMVMSRGRYSVYSLGRYSNRTANDSKTLKTRCETRCINKVEQHSIAQFKFFGIHFLHLYLLFFFYKKQLRYQISPQIS